MRDTNWSEDYFMNAEIQSAPQAGLDWQTKSKLLLEAGCWLLCVCVLLQNSSVQPWSHLIQFPSNPLSVQSCPLSLPHPDHFIFCFSPLLWSLLLLADPAVSSAFHSCYSLLFLCSSLLLSVPPTPPPLLHPLFSSLTVSFMMWRSMMCPWPRYESRSSPLSRLYWPITSLHSLTPFPSFFSHPPSSLFQSLLLIDKPLFYPSAKSHILAPISR